LDFGFNLRNLKSQVVEFRAQVAETQVLKSQISETQISDLRKLRL